MNEKNLSGEPKGSEKPSYREKQREKMLEKARKEQKQTRDAEKFDRRQELELKRKILTKEVLEQRIKEDKDNFFGSGEHLMDEENVQRAALQNSQLKWAMHPYANARHEHLDRMQDLTVKSEKRHLLGAGSVGVKLSGNAYCCREHEICVYEMRAIETNIE